MDEGNTGAHDGVRRAATYESAHPDRGPNRRAFNIGYSHGRCRIRLLTQPEEPRHRARRRSPRIDMSSDLRTRGPAGQRSARGRASSPTIGRTLRPLTWPTNIRHLPWPTGMAPSHGMDPGLRANFCVAGHARQSVPDAQSGCARCGTWAYALLHKRHFSRFRRLRWLDPITP